MSAERLLVVRVGAMGDVLHALPAVAALRRQRPELEIDWVVDPRWAPLLRAGEAPGPVVDRVLLAETKLWSKAPLSAEARRSVLGLRSELRASGYAVAVDMQGTLRSAVIGRMARPKRLFGYADPREAAAAWFYSRRCVRRGEHVVEQGAALLGEACDLSLAPVPAELPRESWAENWAEELAAGAHLCVLAASAGWGAKQWPAERYAELARELGLRGFRVVVNAPRKDDAIALAVSKGSDGAAEVVVCDVTGLIALLRRAALVVGGDSGPVHLAAMLRVPLVALYGPTDPARNGPWGPGPKRVLRRADSVTSYKRRPEIDPGLARMGVEEVLEAALAVVPG